MASRQATKRLQKEFKSIQNSPPPYIIAKPNDENILEWHYVITGPEGTPYEGGQYHGILRFPTDYPFKPPAISIITPNGRFSTNTRLCLSMSDYHPDTWNPAWSVATILTGLLSFMTGDESTTGSIQTTDAVKKKLAADSKRWNNQENPRFTRLFSDLVAQNRTDIAKAEEEKLKLLNEQNERKKNDGTNVEIDLSKLDPEERARLANAASNTERLCIIM
ncbi:MAG: ubiquitin-conjugating enzyme E2 [Asgard group archaeon]|nr:ubiquitin-conjugating enzyme E2 [Asgard group archaeon]